ncbi:uncharacterized protein LOC114546128 [Perca flavescens]|uniref:uncharacterized protein LOC114546128 n=1 Tax=Perca flavescens TaxID=8167 RepID=UPI00106E69A7|nr:uncharacterized protein LOC114546128 [Perca flavescens]
MSSCHSKDLGGSSGGRVVIYQLEDLPVVPVRPGDDVILPCQAADPFIRAVEWTRADLKTDNVLLYRDGYLDPTYQHPNFKDRVELVDRDLKDGDVSLILKNVNINDTGKYKCRVKTNDSDPIIIIRLQVTEPDLIVVTVHPGDDAILPCQAADSSIIFVEWSRPDLEPDNILYYRNENWNTTYQHPDYKDRVELVDRDLKDRDASLILKNVSRHDTETYKCLVKTIRSGRPKGDTDSYQIRTIRLQVTDLMEVTVDPGDDVILPCQAAGSSIRAVKWTRPDLEPDYVLYYRDGHLDPTYQHPSFKDRVELVDRDLKDGDASLILKNVISNDAGTYECRVETDGSTRQNRGIEPIRIIRLQVPDSKGNFLIYVAVAAGVGLIFLTVAVVGVLIYKRCNNRRSEQPAAAAAADEASADQLLDNSQSSLQLTGFSCHVCIK